MAIGIGAAIIGGALISGVMGKQAAGDAAGAASDASGRSIGESGRQFDLVRGDTQPYRDVGQSAVYRLADMYGLQHPAQPNLSSAEQQEFQQLKRLQSAPPSAPPDLSVWAEEHGRMPDQQELQQLQHPQQQALTPQQQARIQELEAKSAAPTKPFDLQSTLENTPGYQFRLSEGMKALDRNQSRYRFTPRAAKEMERYSQGIASDEYGRFLESQFRLAGLGGNAVNTSAGAGTSTAGNITAANMTAGNIAGNAAMAGGASINNAVQGGLSNYLTLQSYNNSMKSMRPEPSFNPNFYNA